VGKRRYGDRYAVWTREKSVLMHGFSAVPGRAWATESDPNAVTGVSARQHATMHPAGMSQAGLGCFDMAWRLCMVSCRGCRFELVTEATNAVKRRSFG